MLSNIDAKAALVAMQQDGQFYIYINNSKAPVNLFYVPDIPDKLGSFFWCQVGQHVCNNNCRFPVNMVRDVFVGKMSTTFRNNSAARDAQGELCFSICSSTFAQDLEASSAEVVDTFIAGIDYLVSGDGKSMTNVENVNDDVKENETQVNTQDVEKDVLNEERMKHIQQVVATGSPVLSYKTNSTVKTKSILHYIQSTQTFEQRDTNKEVLSQVSFSDLTDVFVGTEHESFSTHSDSVADRCLALVGATDYMAVEFENQADTDNWLDYIANQFQSMGTDVISVLDPTVNNNSTTTTDNATKSNTSEDLEDVLAPLPVATVGTNMSSQPDKNTPNKQPRNRRYSVMPSNNNFEADVASVGISVLLNGKMACTLLVTEGSLLFQGEVNESIELTSLYSQRRASSDRVVFTCKDKSIEIILDPIQLNGVISMVNANLRRLALTLQPSGSKYVVVAYDPALMSVSLQNINDDDNDPINILRRGACMRRYFSTKGQANSTLLWVYLDTHRFFTSGELKYGVLRYVPLVSVARVLGLDRRGLSSEDLIHDLHQILHTLHLKRVCDVLTQAEELTVAVGADVGSNGAIPLKTQSDVYLGRTTASLLALVEEADQHNCFTLLFKGDKDTVLSLRSINASTTQVWIDSIKAVLSTPETSDNNNTTTTTNTNSTIRSTTGTTNGTEGAVPGKRTGERRMTIISATDMKKSTTANTSTTNTQNNSKLSNTSMPSSNNATSENVDKQQLLAGFTVTVAGLQEDFNKSVFIPGKVLQEPNYISDKVTLRYTSNGAKHGCLYVSMEDPDFNNLEAASQNNSFECVPQHTISDIVLGKADAVLKSVAHQLLAPCNNNSPYKSDQCLLIRSKRGSSLRLLFDSNADCKQTVAALQYIISSQGKNIKYDQSGSKAPPVVQKVAPPKKLIPTSDSVRPQGSASKNPAPSQIAIAQEPVVELSDTVSTSSHQSVPELTATQALQTLTTPIKIIQVVSGCEIEDVVLWLEPKTKCLLYVEDGKPLAPILNSSTGGVSNGIYLDYLSDVFVGKAADITQEAIDTKLLQASEEYCLSFFAVDPFTSQDISLHVVAKHLAAFHRWCQALSIILTQGGASLQSVE